jgi:hypothetical protein
MTKTSMKPVERALAVLRLEEPERVPHFEWEYHSRTIHALTSGGDNFDLGEQSDSGAVRVGVIHKYGRYPLDMDLLASAV